MEVLILMAFLRRIPLTLLTVPKSVLVSSLGAIPNLSKEKPRVFKVKSTILHFLLSSSFRDILGYSLALVFFFYLVVFACVAPSPALTGAVAFEIIVYALFLAYRIKRRKAKSVNARQSITAGLLLAIPGGEAIFSLCSAFMALIMSLVLVGAIIDAVSFGLAVVGRYNAAALMYSRFPVSTLAGVSPGYTMELLSGAKMKAGNYADVERMYKALLDVRVKHFGARSERVCDIYADFGDLAERRGDWQKAERLYVDAIKLSNEIKVPQGCGKYLTRLGQLQSDHGHFDEALKTLAEAASMRSRIFGDGSSKVADTMLVTAKVYQKMGHAQQAETLAFQARMILKALPKTEVNLAVYSALVSLLVMAAVYFLTDKNGWLAQFAVVRLESLLRRENISPSKKAKIESHLQVLTEFIASPKDSKRSLSNNHEGTGLCLILSLTSQDLR